MRLIISVFFFLLLAGCTSTYAPMNGAGGYSDLQLSDNVYRITVAGNGYTSKETVQQFALLRASELTLAAGRQRFVILNDSVDSKSQTVTIGSGSSTTTFFGSTAYSTFDAPQILTITKAGGSIVIEIIPRSDPRFPTAYDAKLLERQLRPVLELPK